MLLTVIIPLYNSDCIEKQLLSIRSLENEGITLEFIFIDDGSDGIHQKTILWLLESNKNTHQYIYHSLGEKNWKNRVCLARNIGAQMAKWDYLVFIDQDTILHKNYISHIVHTWVWDRVIIGPYLGYNNEKKLINDTDIDSFIQNGIVEKPGFVDFRIPHYQEKNEQWRIWEFFWASNFLIKKDIFLSIGGFDGDIITWGDEDVEFWYRLNATGYSIFFDRTMQVLNLSKKLYQEPFSILEKHHIPSLTENWVYNAKKHSYHPDYLRYISDRWHHLPSWYKQQASQNFRKFLIKHEI